MKRNNKLDKKKQEITLMTLLANEATKESSQLLQQYGKPKPKDFVDMEVKLAELYFEQPDKVVIEKKLAEIHPHKNWLIRTLDLEKKKENVIEEPVVEQPDQIQKIKDAVVESVSKFSDFNGTKDQPIVSEKSDRVSSMEIIGIVGVIGLIGLTFIIVSKNLKK
jgi:hypothetical protein